MNCLSNMCYVCLKKKDTLLININSSLSVNKDIIHILGDLPFNLAWLKTKQIILICEECCLHLRKTYQFLAMCLKNSALLKGYMDKLSTATMSNADNEAELLVDLNTRHSDINEMKCDIKLEEEEIYTFEWGPIIGNTEDEFENVDDSFVKEEDTWKREVVDDNEETLMDNNSIENSDNKMDSEISVNSDVHHTDMDSNSSVFICNQVGTTDKNKLNTTVKTLHKCLTCNKSFTQKVKVQTGTQIHTGAKLDKCARCKTYFKRYLTRHMRIHTGEKPYECTICEKRFCRSGIKYHMLIHRGEKPYECSICKQTFRISSQLMQHMRTHTGNQPVE